VRRKISGHIFDSIVVGGFSQFAKGISQLTRWGWLQRILNWSARLYLEGWNADVYESSIQTFKVGYCLISPWAWLHSLFRKNQSGSVIFCNYEPILMTFTEVILLISC